MPKLLKKEEQIISSILSIRSERGENTNLTLAQRAGVAKMAMRHGAQQIAIMVGRTPQAVNGYIRDAKSGVFRIEHVLTNAIAIRRS